MNESRYTYQPSPPTPTVVEKDGFLSIEWPDPKPEQFLISSDLFAVMVALINEARGLSDLG
jgi:hypothetical protein